MRTGTRFGAAVGAALLVGSTTGPSAQASSWEVGVSQFSFTTGSCFPALGGPSASGSWAESSGGSGNASATAAGVRGTLRGFASSSSLGNKSFSNQIGACFRGVVLIDDILISGPGSTVSTQLRADLDGSIASSSNLGGSTGARLTASVQPFTFAGIPLAPAVNFDTTAANTVVDTTLTTASFDAPVGTPFAVELTILGRATTTAVQGVLPDPGLADVVNDFDNSLTFAQGQPVFVLPAGYTASSTDGGIVDNAFELAPHVPALGLPAWAVLAGLLALLGGPALARTRRRRS